MTNAEIIAKIRAEIERLQPNAPKPGNMKSVDAKVAMLVHARLNKLLSFLSDLEKSLPVKVTDGEELEKEIERFFPESAFDTGWNYDDMQEVAHHFYELGCRRTAEKYDGIEYNRQRAEEPPVALVAIKPIIPEALKPCIATFKEHGGSSEIPNALEEAAKKKKKENTGIYPEVGQTSIRDAFIDGAKWQADHAPLPEDTALYYKGLEEGKRMMMEEMSECFAQLKQVQSESINMSAVREQLAYNRGAADERYRMRKKMMEDAVEIGTTEICWVPDGDRVFPTFDPPVEDLLMPGIISQRFNGGDKVRVIIIKKED